MNRIQQILSKAERDGTARRPSIDEDSSARHAGPAVAPPPPDTFYEAPAYEPAVENVLEAPRYESDEPSTAQVSLEAVLDPILVAALEPLSPAAEQYRTLRARLSQTEDNHPVRVIQVTSPGKGDGKTVTALNLALTMAQEFQRRVLILDADLRSPSINNLLGLPPGPGLVDVLTGAAALEEALVEIPEHHLTVLRAGRAYERPAEMLGSGPMRRLVDSLRTQFDRIVVDSAPTTVADAGAVAPLSDGLLLVVRASTTTTPAIARAIATLTSAKLLGLVFNESSAPVQEPYAASA
jgi:capsular exopolysaccharide synthesis family protein